MFNACGTYNDYIFVSERWEHDAAQELAGYQCDASVRCANSEFHRMHKEAAAAVVELEE